MRWQNSFFNKWMKQSALVENQTVSQQKRLHKDIRDTCRHLSFEDLYTFVALCPYAFATFRHFYFYLHTEGNADSIASPDATGWVRAYCKQCDSKLKRGKRAWFTSTPSNSQEVRLLLIFSWTIGSTTQTIPSYQYWYRKRRCFFHSLTETVAPSPSVWAVTFISLLWQ